MANPPTYPSDGRMTTLQNYTATLPSTALMEVVSPGNASLGVNYNVTLQQLAMGLLPAFPAESPNQIFAGPSSGNASAVPTFRALVPADLPGLQRNVHTGSYAVATTDFNNLIALNGTPSGLPFVLSAGPAANYMSNFVVTIYNESQTRGWAIAPNGLATFVLWPLQTVQLFNDNNIWAVSPNGQRWKPAQPITLNVDNVNGTNSAANDGLGGQGTNGAFATSQHAFNVVQGNFDQSGLVALIQVPLTTSVPITETPTFSGAMPTGVGEITIQGNTTNALACQWQFTSNQNIFVTDYQSLTFKGIGFSATSTGNTFVTGSQFAVLDFFNCDFGPNPSGLSITVSANARANVLGGCSISGTASAVGFVQAAHNASVNLQTPIALNNGTTLNIGQFAIATDGGEFSLSGFAFTGAGTATIVGTRFVSASGGIVVGDSGVSWPSGMSAGVVENGGLSDAGAANYNGSATILAATPLVSGGATGAGYTFFSVTDLGMFAGAGVPTLTAATSALYLRNDALSSTTRLYINTNGGSTWVGLMATG